MPLLADYAITPDVFDVTSYTREEVCGLHIERIREVLLTEGLVRDLRDGEWRDVFSASDRLWYPRPRTIRHGVPRRSAPKMRCRSPAASSSENPSRRPT